MLLRASCAESEIVKKTDVIKNKKNVLSILDGDGDFRSQECIDLLKESDIVVTNPPFSLMNDFILKGLWQADKYLVLLGKIQTLETVERANILKHTPLKFVYVHSKRQATWKNGEPRDPKGKPWATTMCLAWFIWEIGWQGEPVIRWI